MLRISTSAEARVDDQQQQHAEGRSPSQSPANSQDNNGVNVANSPSTTEERATEAGMDDVAAAPVAALQQSMIFDREADDSMNHSTASASLTSPNRLEQLRANQEMMSVNNSSAQGRGGKFDLSQQAVSSPISPSNKSTASSRPDDERSMMEDEPLSAKRLFLQEESEGVEIHQPFSYDCDESIGELAQFLTPQDEEDDEDDADAEENSDRNITDYDNSHQYPRSHGATLPQHEKILFEERISQLHQQLAAVEAERDALLNKDHQNIQNMYQDPYASPMKQDIIANTGTSPSPSTVCPIASPAANSSPSPSLASKQYSQEQVDELHKQVVELQTHIDELLNKQRSLEEGKRRLKLALKSVEMHENQKSDLLQTLSKDMAESTERESMLRMELDSCRVKLEGYEMAQAHLLGQRERGEESIQNPSDVATALVVSEKHNQALQAHMDELQAQNQSFQKRIAELEKEILPKGDKEKQLYSRYVEMKASLSSLAGVLEEVNGQNQMLNARVVQLETEIAGEGTSSDAVVVPTAQESGKLQARVQELEGQVDDLLKTEKMHNIRCKELEAAIESLESSSSDKSRTGPSLTPVPTDMEKEELQGRLKHLEGIVHSMSQVELSYKKRIRFLEGSSSNLQMVKSNPTEEGVEMAATSSAESIAADNNLGASSYGTSSVESTSEQILESSSSAWTSADSSDDSSAHRDPLSRKLEVCKTELKKERKQVSKLSKELHLSQSREAEFKTAVAKLTDKLQSANSNKKRAQLRAELDSLKDAMEDAALESNQLLGEMETLLTSTQQELRNEQAKSKDLETKLRILENQQQQSEADVWDQSERLDNDDNELEFIKRKNVALKEDLKSLKIQAETRSVELETILAQTQNDLVLEQQKVTVMSQESVNRRNLEDRLRSTRNELSSFNIMDILAPAVMPPTTSERELNDLRLKNKELETEIASLKTEMQSELNRIKREVILINSQEMDMEREEVQLVCQLQDKNSYLGGEPDCFKVPEVDSKAAEQNPTQLKQQNALLQEQLSKAPKEQKAARSDAAQLKNALEETKSLLAAEQLQVQRLNGTLISLRMEIDSKLDTLVSSHKDEISSKDKQIDSLNVTLSAFRMEVDAFRTDIKKANELAEDKEEEARIANLELARERQRITDLSAKVVSLRSEKSSVEDIAGENSMLRSELCNLKGDLEIADQELEGLKAQTRKLEDSLLSARKDLEANGEKLVQAKQSNAALQAEVEVLRNAVKARTDEATYQKVEVSATLASNQKELEGERQKLLDLKSANAALQKAVDALQKNLDSLNTQAETVTREKLVLEEKFKNKEAELHLQLESDKQEIESLKIANDALERDATNRRKEAESAIALLGKTKEEMAELESEFSVSKLKFNDLTFEKSDLTDQLESCVIELQQTKSLLQTTEHLKSQLEVKVDEIKDLLASEHQQLEGLKAEKLSLQAHQQSLESKLATLVAEKDVVAASLIKTAQDLNAEQAKVGKLKEDLNSANNEIGDLSEKLESELEEKLESERFLNETQMKLADEQRTLQVSLQQNSELQSNLTETQSSLDVATIQLSSLQKTIVETRSCLDNEKIVVQDLSAAKVSLEMRREELERDLTTSMAQVARLEGTLVETRESLQSHQVKVEELTIEGISLRAELNSLRSHVETTNARASMVTDHKTELETLLSTTKDLLETERKKVDELQSSNTTLRSDMESLKIEMGTLEARFKQTSEERVATESELMSTRQSFAEEQAAHNQLKTELSNQQSIHEELKGSHESATSRNILLTGHKDELETLLQTTKALLDDEIKKVTDMSDLKTSLESKLSDCQAELLELSKEMESAFSRANFASKKKDELELALASIEEERQQGLRRNQDMNATNSVLRTELNNLRADFEHASSQAMEIKETYEGLLGEAKLELSDLKKHLDSQRAKMEEHVEKYDSLQAEYTTLKENHDHEYAKIVEAKKKLDSKLNESRERTRLERQRVEELKQHNGDLQTDLNKMRCDLKNATEKATLAEGDYDSQIASSKWELIAEQQKAEELSSTNQSLEAELVNLRERLANGESDVKQRCSELEKDLATAEKQMEQSDGTIASLKQQIKSLTKRLEEGEASRQNLNRKVDKANSEIQTVKQEADARHTHLESLLLATKEDLLKEQQKVEDYSKLESSMQFELDSLKEAMHQTVTTDREKALAALREELESEKEKSAELTKSKLSLQSKLRVLQQNKDSKKANAFVQERETDMILASTKKELESCRQSNEELRGKIHTLELNHEESLTAAEREFSQKLEEYVRLEEDFERIEEDLKHSSDLNVELTNRIESMEIDRNEQKAENKMLSKELEKKEKALEELSTLKDKLSTERDRSSNLAADKSYLETQLRVATHAAENANASAGVRVWETEMVLSNTKKELEESLQKNAALASRIALLETSLHDLEASHEDRMLEADNEHEKSKTELTSAVTSIQNLTEKLTSLQSQAASFAKEKESLLERTASLARRDQLQKASLSTSDEEINRLQQTVSDFQERFQFLADQLKDSQSLNQSLQIEKENIERNLQHNQNEWKSERSAFQKRIESLERAVQESRDALESVRIEYNNVQSREAELETDLNSCREELKTLQTLQERWNSERMMFTQRVHDLTNDLQEGAEAVDVARRESIVTAQQILEEQQSQWRVERESLQERTANLDNDLKSTRDELRACREEIIGRDRQLEQLQTTYQEKLSSIEEEMLDTRVALQNSEQNAKEGFSKQGEVQSKLDAQSKELQEYKDQLSTEKCIVVELEAKVSEKEKDIRSLMEQMEHHEGRVKDLQAEKDRLSEELANSLRQAVEKSEHQRSLKKVESDLDEAQIREGILESMLSECKKELNICKEELEVCKKEVFDEKYCNGVYKELISKLNRANDSLEQKNRKLSEANGNPKTVTASERSVDGMASHDCSPVEDNVFLRNQEKFTTEISNMDRQLQSLASERDALKSTAVSLQDKVDTLQQTNDELQDMVEKLESLQAEGAREQNERLEAELAKSQKAMAEVSNKAKGMRHKMSQEIEAAKIKEAALTKEIQALKAGNEVMEKRLEEQEKELDEFEQDFAMARDDARKVVEELRGQVQQLERRNQQLTGDNTVKKVDELKNKLRQLISQNQRLQKDIEGFKSREKKLQRELGLGGWK